MKCLNCGHENVEVFCARCGQRHIDVEQFNVLGLAGDYSRHTVGKLTLVRSLWTLLRYPGQLTADYVAGRRISQINPVVLFVFLWTTLLTLQNLFVADPAELMADTDAAMRALGLPASEPTRFDELQREHLIRFGWIQAWFLNYVEPLSSLLVNVALVRLLASRSWVESVVFSLHLQAAWILIASPTILVNLAAVFSVWALLVGTPFVLLIVVCQLLYSWLVFRHLFSDELPVPIAVWTLWICVSWLLGALGVVVTTVGVTAAGMSWIHFVG